MILRPYVLIQLLVMIEILSVECDYELNPDTQDNPFYREDSYVYVEDIPDNVNSRSLSTQEDTMISNVF